MIAERGYTPPEQVVLKLKPCPQPNIYESLFFPLNQPAIDTVSVNDKQFNTQKAALKALLLLNLGNATNLLEDTIFLNLDPYKKEYANKMIQRYTA